MQRPHALRCIVIADHGFHLHIYRPKTSSPFRHFSMHRSYMQIQRITVSMNCKTYEQYKRVFEHFDRDRDGKISPAELQQCVATMGAELTEEEAEEAVRYSDTDGDGLLGVEEFVRFVEGGKEEEKVEDLKVAFKMYEMEESGCITPKSLKRVLSRLGDSRTIEQCQVMIQKFDLDGDGVLDFEEFKVMML